MKKQDFIVIILVILFFVPFFVFDNVYQLYLSANQSNPYLMAFAKFAILSTFGEMVAMRIKTGNYYNSSFGLLPKMLVWGILGMWIAFSMKVFSIGVPSVVDKIIGGSSDLIDAMQNPFSPTKLLGAFCISLIMNTSFAPVFMTLHKVTDTHIAKYNGKIVCLTKPIQATEILSSIDWKVQWRFVFKKTIPFFWIPAHTITFILPAEFQVLFAALLGIALGLILAFAAMKKS